MADSELNPLLGNGVRPLRWGALFSSVKHGINEGKVSRLEISSSKEGDNMNHEQGHHAPDDPMKNKHKPIHEVRLGFIKAAVWRNETEAGIRYNVTVSRLYKDGEQWGSTESFGRDDLLVLAKVADQAHSWICAQNQEDANAAKA